jgi:GTP cyclohydrolase-4
MTDVQNQQLNGSFKLTRVGVRDVRKPVRVSRPGKEVTLTVTFDLFVDLPAELKGSHMSRNLEVLSRVIDDAVRGEVTGLEDLGVRICRELLTRHEYASRSEVMLSADYFLERGMGNGTTSLERYMLKASANSVRGGKTRKSIGVEVTGMTACPCAMEEVRKIRGVCANDTLASITHNQRNITSVTMEVPVESELEADKLIAIIERCLSSPTYEILKRADEARVVMDAHSNPKFVEDVVRSVLSEILKEFSDLPDDVRVSVKSESFESIHKHNAYAERDTTMGELRE